MGHRLQQSVKSIKKKETEIETDQKGAEIPAGKKKEKETDQYGAEIPAGKKVGAKKPKRSKIHQR